MHKGEPKNDHPSTWEQQWQTPPLQPAREIPRPSRGVDWYGSWEWAMFLARSSFEHGECSERWNPEWWYYSAVARAARATREQRA